MAFPRSFFWVPIWATGFFVAVGSVWAAEDAKPPSPPNPRAAVERALDKTLAFDLTEAALDDVVDWLRSELKISIHVDRRSLDDIGIGIETPITFQLSGIPVRNALDLLLEELDLTWLIHDNVLVITSVETAEATLETKTYDVADLVVRLDDRDDHHDGPSQQLGRGRRERFNRAL